MRNVVAVLAGVLLSLGNIGIALALGKSHEREVFVNSHAILQEFGKFFHRREERRIQIDVVIIRSPAQHLEFGIAERRAIRKQVCLKRGAFFE